MLVPYVYKQQGESFSLRRRSDDVVLVFPLVRTPGLPLHAGTVWDASMVLAEWANLCSGLDGRRWDGMPVYDLSAGAGLLSLVLEALGARVTCSETSDAVAQLERNVAHRPAIRVEALAWGQRASPCKWMFVA